MPDSVDPEHPQQPNPESESEQPVEQDRTGGQHQPWHYRSAQQAEPSRPFGPSAPLRRLWFNAALRIGRSTTVHAIRFDPINEAGDERVAPACHTGHDRPDHSADLHQVRDQAISCRNCLSYPVARADGESYEPGLNQLLLPLPGVPPLPSWPPHNA